MSPFGAFATFVRHTGNRALHFGIVKFTAHEAFDRENCILGVND